MNYAPDLVKKLQEEHGAAQRRLTRAYLSIVQFAQGGLKNDAAREFMMQGAARRMRTIARAAENIFRKFPPDRERPLPREVLEDITINLHAFVLHVNAVQDNLAWAFVKEHGLSLRRFDVSLFKDPLKLQLPQAIQNYLGGAEIMDWHKSYSTDYRDALAHRIPLYVPPSLLIGDQVEIAQDLQSRFNERLEAYDFEAVIELQEKMNSLGVACTHFVHSFDSSAPLVLHPQIVCDALTAAELCEVVIGNWGPPP